MHIDSADALVIGGGPAGLSAAIYLARYNRSVIVFDSGHGRSTHHQINHNYLGFPGGVPTVKIRDLGRKQLAEYEKVKLYEHKVERISGDAVSGFLAHTQEHDYTGRVVVIATGVLDHFPHFHGWEPYVGVSMFWCITCDGYESKGKNILVVGHTNDSASEAMQLHSLTDRIQLLTNSQTFEITETFQRRLANAAELDDDRWHLVVAVAAGFVAKDLVDALGVERFEVEAVGGVEVGRDGLGVGVDHDRGDACVVEGVGGLDGTVVELDALTDADGAGTDDQGAGAFDRRGLVFLFVG
jgi:thioredoxin reductase